MFSNIGSVSGKPQMSLETQVWTSSPPIGSDLTAPSISWPTTAGFDGYAKKAFKVFPRG